MVKAELGCCPCCGSQLGLWKHRFWCHVLLFGPRVQSPSQRLSQFRYRKEEERTLDFTSGIQKAPQYCVCLPLLEKPCLLGSPSNLSSSVLGTERLLPNSSWDERDTLCGPASPVLASPSPLLSAGDLSLSLYPSGWLQLVPKMGRERPPPQIIMAKSSKEKQFIKAGF